MGRRYNNEQQEDERIAGSHCCHRVHEREREERELWVVLESDAEECLVFIWVLKKTSGQTKRGFN